MASHAITPDLRQRWLKAIDAYEPMRAGGKIISARGLMLTCKMPAAVNDRCEILTGQGNVCRGEVVGFANDLAFLFLYENNDHIRPNMPVINRGHGAQIPTGAGLLGRVIDGIGRPMDDRGPLIGCRTRTWQLTAPPPLRRERIREIFRTNLRSIDGLLTLGRGQRVGIFSGSGVGKSTLLGEIAKSSDAEVNVIALIGERGGEVKPFIEDCLGPGLKKSVVVVANCDEPPLMRVRAAQLALAIADTFRRQGAHVLLMCDSLTRLAMAQRQIGIAHGEPPSARSYTPSVFQLLASYVECMGNAARGSITGILTVLVDGDDFDEPITDAVRSYVDGHIVLDRRLAEIGHFPAISVGQSISRIMNDVTDQAHQAAARKLRAILATYAQAEDLIRIGAYVRGSMPAIDKAIELREKILPWLRQAKNERSTMAQTREAMDRIAAAWNFLNLAAKPMKRSTFRLGSVLRFYVLQKQKAEFELQKASRILQDIEVEIACWDEEITAVAELLRGAAGEQLTISGWLACYRKAESLDRLITAARLRRTRQLEILASIQEQRKRWSIAEETLLELRRNVDRGNEVEAAKSQQMLLDDTVLRRWLDKPNEEA